MQSERYGHDLLTRDNDLSKTAESLGIIRRMEEALAANSNDMGAHFKNDFRWMGNYGSGTKQNLDEFRSNWQLPLRAAFTGREYFTRAWIAQGEWVSCFGHIEGTHSGEFMGIVATGERIIIPYMDFWHVQDGKIADNWVSVDYPFVLAQLGKDVFSGQGWEAYDEGRATPAVP